VKRILHFGKIVLSKIPLFGGLVHARRQDFTSAASEVSVNVIFSTLPIWLGPIIIWILYFQDKNLQSLLADNIAEGEFYIYATTLLSPLFYFLWQDVRGAKSFPSGLSISVLSFVVVSLSAGLYGARKANVFIFDAVTHNGGNVSLQLNDAGYLKFSMIIYGLTLLIVYIAHVFKNLRLSGAAAVAGDETRDFANQFAGRNHG